MVKIIKQKLKLYTSSKLSKYKKQEINNKEEIENQNYSTLGSVAYPYKYEYTSLRYCPKSNSSLYIEI